MHIVEKNEKLDWPTFWAHGHGIEEWGPMFWELTEGGADTFPCSTCKPGAQAGTHGFHDVINVIKGKGVHTPEHFAMLHDMVEYAWKHRGAKPCHGANCRRALHVG